MTMNDLLKKIMILIVAIGLFVSAVFIFDLPLRLFTKTRFMNFRSISIKKCL